MSGRERVEEVKKGKDSSLRLDLSWRSLREPLFSSLLTLAPVLEKLCL
jgi:hypothetical protein